MTLWQPLHTCCSSFGDLMAMPLSELLHQPMNILTMVVHNELAIILSHRITNLNTTVHAPNTMCVLYRDAHVGFNGDKIVSGSPHAYVRIIRERTSRCLHGYTCNVLMLSPCKHQLLRPAQGGYDVTRYLGRGVIKVHSHVMLHTHGGVLFRRLVHELYSTVQRQTGTRAELL